MKHDVKLYFNITSHSNTWCVRILNNTNILRIKQAVPSLFSLVAETVMCLPWKSNGELTVVNAIKGSVSEISPTMTQGEHRATG